MILVHQIKSSLVYGFHLPQHQALFYSDVFFSPCVYQSSCRALSKQHGTNNISPTDRQDEIILSLSLVSQY